LTAAQLPEAYHTAGLGLLFELSSGGCLADHPSGQSTKIGRGASQHNVPEASPENQTCPPKN